MAPGAFETEGAFSRLDPGGESRRRMKDGIPVGRIGEIEEVANMVLYMVSDYASWLNGSTIRLDGGYLPFQAGMTKDLVKIENQQWDEMEKMIRSTNTKSKL